MRISRIIPLVEDALNTHDLIRSPKEADYVAASLKRRLEVYKESTGSSYIMTADLRQMLFDLATSYSTVFRRTHSDAGEVARSLFSHLVDLQRGEARGSWGHGP